MALEPEWVRIASDWVLYLATGAAGGIGAVWSSSRRRDAARKREIDALATTQAQHQDRLSRMEITHESRPKGDACQSHLERLARLEEGHKAAPSQDGIKHIEERIHARIDAVAKDVAEMRGEMRANTGLLRTLDQHLRDHPR